MLGIHRTTQRRAEGAAACESQSSTRGLPLVAGTGLALVAPNNRGPAGEAHGLLLGHHLWFSCIENILSFVLICFIVSSCYKIHPDFYHPVSYKANLSRGCWVLISLNIRFELVPNTKSLSFIEMLNHRWRIQCWFLTFPWWHKNVVWWHIWDAIARFYEMMA